MQVKGMHIFIQVNAAARTITSQRGTLTGRLHCNFSVEERATELISRP
jgi:hypothetical protein